MTPVDYVTQTIVSISERNTDNIAFNIYNPNSLSYGGIGQIASERYGLDPIPYDQFREILLRF